MCIHTHVLAALCLLPLSACIVHALLQHRAALYIIGRRDLRFVKSSAWGLVYGAQIGQRSLVERLDALMDPSP